MAPRYDADEAARHDREVRRDLERLNVPAVSWPSARPGPDGAPMPDVLIVGAGMSGLSAAVVFFH